MFESLQEAAGYLAGVIDGEGTVTNSENGQRRIVIANTDFKIIEALVEACDLLGISFSYRRVEPRSPRHKPHWLFFITKRRNLIRLHQIVTLRGEKQEILDALISGYRYALKQ